MPTGVRAVAGPTMRDVAREAGVSKALVSIVFRNAPGASEANRDRVFAAAERLGYRTNRTASLLARSRTRQLGMVVDLRNTFHTEVVDAVLAAADDAGYQVVLSPWTGRHPEERAVATAMELRCEALLIVGTELEPAALVTLTGDRPVVSIGRHLGLPGTDVVTCSEEAGMEQVVDHLVGLGHRRIAHVDGGPVGVGAARRAGFLAGMARHGLAEGAVVVRGGGGEEAGRAAVVALLDLAERPSAVAAFNDHCALGVIDALAAAGVRVPQEMSVTGYDDTPTSRLRTVDLTTVAQEPQQLGRWAVAAALERLDAGRDTPREEVLVPRLVPRGTSTQPTSTHPHDP